MKKMYKLFESTELGGMKLANRFVRSATWEGMATEGGECTDKLIRLMSELAKGKVGMIVTGHAYARKDGQASLRQLGIHEDRLIEGLRGMTRTVHDEGSRIVMQISHGGLFANEQLSGHRPVALSPIENLTKISPEILSAGDIEKLETAYIRAALRAREAEFDGVQIHAGHGYLMNQSLSPYFNKRTDRYGGPLENRARALLNVLKGMKAEAGEDYPILIKLNSQDYINGGLSLTESLEVGLMLQEAGIDGIELTGGATRFPCESLPYRIGIKSRDQEAYFRDAGKRFKERLKVPIVLVGGIRSFELAEQLVEDGYADYISMSRPFIREPHLIKRWKSGDLEKARCLSDNRCLEPTRGGKGLYCVVENIEKGTG